MRGAKVERRQRRHQRGAKLRASFRLLACAAGLPLLFALGCIEPSEFVSADLDADAGGPGLDVLTLTPQARAEDEVEVEEGDIYRVLPDHRILNLNSYRGLQIIDFDDVTAPRIVGRLRLPGVPVEAYVRGDRAFVLLRSHVGYGSEPGSLEARLQAGSLALAIDLSDPTAPVVTDRAPLPGNVVAGRMVHGAARAALYVVAGAYQEWLEGDGSYRWEYLTQVRSFDVSDGALTQRSQLDLGGYVNAVQATTDALLVARVDSGDWRRSRVGLVDISDPGGAMVEGDEVHLEGSVRNQFAMDLNADVLRVVVNDRKARTNRLYTFDVSDRSHFQAADEVAFGDGQDLFASLFLGNKAFFVTFLRIDPFHSFEIDEEGRAREVSEFEVSGWNDFFRAVSDERRLIGIGTDTDGGLSAAVSLYDITDLANPEPLVDRAAIEGSQWWSEAHWDHRAFSVLEDSVDVAGPGGLRETGLVLLPYAAYDQDTLQLEQGVQIFTFSEESLTLRGSMEQGSAVRRSFQPEPDLTANLSTTTVSFFDTHDPDAPEQTSRLDLNPNYTRLLLLGDHAVRARDTRDPWAWWLWYWPSALDPSATLETIDLAGDPDTAEAIARFEVPYDAELLAVGDHLVTWRIDRTGKEPERRIVVYDVSDPSDPHAIGSLSLPGPPAHYGCYGPLDVVASLSIRPCIHPYGYGEETLVVEDAVVFVEHEQRSEEIGTETLCSSRPTQTSTCWDGEVRDWIEGCTEHSGSIICSTPDGGETSCSGNYRRCTWNAAGAKICSEADPGEVETVESCFERPIVDYWLQTRFRVVDLSDPSQPRSDGPIELSRGDRGATGLADGSSLWVSFKRAVESPTQQPLARHYVQRFDLSDPSSPAADAPVNVPGSLVAVDGDRIFTRDLQWADGTTESSVHRLRIEDGVAHLEASRAFPGSWPQEIRLDGGGNVLVSQSDSPGSTLVLLDAEGDLGVRGRFGVDSWTSLRLALPGRAVLEGSGGHLILDTEDPTRPFARSAVSYAIWSRELVHTGRRLFVVAGLPGIVEADLDAFDIEPPEGP